jgi:fructose-1,6-bisphosphatase/inositol monophosphatase family enzyme
MLDPTVSRWDISAVIPIVEEAGGRCSRIDGKPWEETIDDAGHYQLLSSNTLVHQELLDDFSQ